MDGVLRKSVKCGLSNEGDGPVADGAAGQRSLSEHLGSARESGGWGREAHRATMRCGEHVIGAKRHIAQSAHQPMNGVQRARSAVSVRTTLQSALCRALSRPHPAPKKKKRRRAHLLPPRRYSAQTACRRSSSPRQEHVFLPRVAPPPCLRCPRFAQRLCNRACRPEKASDYSVRDVPPSTPARARQWRCIAPRDRPGRRPRRRAAPSTTRMWAASSISFARITRTC